MLLFLKDVSFFELVITDWLSLRLFFNLKTNTFLVSEASFCQLFGGLSACQDFLRKTGYMHGNPMKRI